MNNPLIKVKDLSVYHEQHALIQKVSFHIHQNEIVLLVGGSGAGKTVFMKILAGLIRSQNTPFEISGSIEIEKENILNHRFRERGNPVGIVFQDYGLFETYSIEQNLDFAFAHSPFKIPSSQQEAMKKRLCQKLSLDPKLNIRHASGGQKRRIAIARTLAYNPEIIIYDEPTAGLDPQMTTNVAALIRSTHEVFAKKASLIVTHQYQEFLDIVDKILFLDPKAKNIVEVKSEELQKLMDQGYFQVPFKEADRTNKKIVTVISSFFRGTTTWTKKAFLMFFQSFLCLLPLWSSLSWGIRFFTHYLRLTTFLSSILYIAMAGSIVGFISGYFTFKFLPYGHFTKPLITEDVLAAIGYGLYRIIVPILTAILVAARCGAAIASDVGNRVYLQEMESMKSLGAVPSRYFQTVITYSVMMALPFLTILAFFLARTFCLWVFLVMYPEFNAVTADALFHGFLDKTPNFFYSGTQWLFYKQLVCGFGLGNICYMVGMRRKNDTRDISRDITLSVILSTLFVLFVHFIFALLEF